VSGVFGQAIEFDGSSYVDCGTDPAFDITNEITVAAWIKLDHVDDRQSIVNKESNEVRGIGYRVGGGGTVHVQLYKQGWVAASDKTDLYSTVSLQPDTWYHVAYTYEFVADGTSKTRLYIDGQEESRTDTTVGPLATNTEPLEIGRYYWSTGYNKWFDGLIDEVLIYTRALTPEEIAEVMKGISPALASDPSPPDGAEDVLRDVVLSWTPGIYAPAINGHTVYFSESFNNVNDGVGGTTQDANSYDPGRLDFDKTYYWRVDEVNGPPDYTVYEGNIWSFTVEPYSHAMENIIVTASSSMSDMGPERTIDGSGLNNNDLHSTNPEDMWLTSPFDLEPGWILYEFDGIYKLHEMWVWNQNQVFEGTIGYGFRDVTIEYSVDGTDYITLGTTHEFARGPGTPDYAHNTTVDLNGVAAKYVRLTAKTNWGGWLLQYGLSEVRFFHIPVRAREPHPDSGATDVHVDVTLGWRAGRQAAEHNVYLSTDEQAVIDGTAPVTVVTETSHSPSSLNLGSTYYWRVNEVNVAETPATWQGDIWSFSTQEYLVVDDFEAYNEIPSGEPGSKLIYETWADGFAANPATNGSAIGYLTAFSMETGIVHGGNQSAPVLYDNSVASLSEVTVDPANLPIGRDWTMGAPETLVLWLYGDPDNTGGQLYVKINGTKVHCNDDTGALSKPWWTQWNIDLASTGANLQNVTEFGIGVDGAGAAGTFYVDDIALYRLAPEAVVPQDPGTENLVAYYAMESNGADSSGNGNNGTPIGSPVYAPGIAGMAMDFDGLDDWLDLGTLDVIGGGITLSMWVNPESYMFNDTRTISKATGTGSDDHWWMVSTNGGNHVLRFRLKTDAGQSTTTLIADSGDVLEGEWTHAAAVWDGSTMRLYRNLELVGSTAKGGTAVAVDPTVGAAIGNQPLDAGDKHWVGLIDEAKIYSRGLTAGELLYIASGQ
jgi:hypothetical protein